MPRQQKRARARESPAAASSAFRHAERTYRRRQAPTDYSECVDCGDLERNTAANAARIRRSPSGACAIAGCPGLWVFPGAVDAATQQRLAFCAYASYHRPPHETNLTALARAAGEAPREEAFCGGGGDAPPAGLRWATLGFHYDWTNRVYPGTRHRMPTHLAAICAGFAARVGEAMVPEAAIVNYYTPDQTMGGHVDDAERDLTRPLVSLSLGCDAVFLFGGETKNTPPTAFWLRSGDVALFTGPARRCYHGVPRILPDTCPPFLSDPGLWVPRGPEDEASEAAATDDVHDAHFARGRARDDAALAALCDYMRRTRLNINVRQVDAASPPAAADDDEPGPG